MKTIINFQFPIDPFNSMVSDGTAGQVLGQIMDELQPEAVYFTAFDGHRGGIMIVEMNDSSEIPRYAEPFFLKFNATVKFFPCMTPDDLKSAGLDKLGQKWG